jgi:hypothetical protein
MPAWSPHGLKPVPARRSALRYAGVTPHMLRRACLRRSGFAQAGGTLRSIPHYAPMVSYGTLHAFIHGLEDRACAPKCAPARRRGFLRRRVNPEFPFSFLDNRWQSRLLG